MQANRVDDLRSVDRQQIQTLCDDLSERAQTMEQEQKLLAQLVEANTTVRPAQAAWYRDVLANVRTRVVRLRAVIDRYCT